MREEEHLLEAAREAALAAGRILREGLDRSRRIHHKGAIDLVTDMDRLAEEAILDVLSRRHPDHSVVAEESAPDTADGAITWYVDPLDGTTNYAHGLPIFAVSVAAYAAGNPLCGVVLDPMRPELYHAVAGGGAFRDLRPIRTSRESRLDQALLATGFPYDLRTDPLDNLDHFQALLRASRGVRRCGAAALDLAYTASGRFDGFWEAKLKPWDVAAGALLVREAGGRATDFAGRELDIRGGEILASGGPLHPAMMAILRQGRTWLSPRPSEPGEHP